MYMVKYDAERCRFRMKTLRTFRRYFDRIDDDDDNDAESGYNTRSSNYVEATRLLMTAACSGDNIAMKELMGLYRNKLLSKEDLATTLRAHKAANDRRKN